MKLLMTSILFFLSSNLLAQFTVGTEWVYTQYDWGYFNPEYLKIEKDTIIDDQTWMVLDGIRKNSCAGNFSKSVIREEGKKVYLLDVPTGQETLLYNFELGEGDSYEVLIFGTDSFFYEINIDSVGVMELNGKERKVQYVDNSDFGRVFIEGIGSIHYLVPQGGLCDPQIFGLRCFTTEEEFIDFDLDRECDVRYFNVPMNTKEIAIAKEFTLFPNPLNSGVLYLKNDSDSRIERIEIFDLEGRKVNSISSYFTTEEINLNDVVNGSYFLRITTNKGVVLKKFLKID